MKRIIVLLSIILVICFAFSPSNMLAAQTATPYLYAFVQQAENGTVTIRAIDPANPTVTTDLLSTSVSPGQDVQKAAPSPDGKWIALTLASWTGRSVRLVNVLTNEVRDMSIGLTTVDFTSVYGPTQQVVWSPNSRYLAFIGVQNNISDVYIYNVEDNTLTNLTNDSSDQYRVAWLQDSSRLAVLKETCSSAKNCTDALDIFDAATKTLQSSISIGQFDFRAGGGFTCRIQWSPSGQYISFLRDCRKSALESSKELYFITISSQTITKLTNFASQPIGAGDPPDRVRYADYEPLWYDAQTMLVGVHYLQDNVNHISATQTLAYTIPAATSATLSTSMVRGWAFNQQTSDLAFLTSTFDNDGQPLSQNSAVRVATFNGSSLNITLSTPDGCNLAWSPNGTYLGYTNRGHPLGSCSDYLRGFVFVEKASGQVREHTLSVDQRSNSIVVAGWIRNKAVSLETPTPTSTPARTLTPGG